MQLPNGKVAKQNQPNNDPQNTSQKTKNLSNTNLTKSRWWTWYCYM